MATQHVHLIIITITMITMIVLLTMIDLHHKSMDHHLSPHATLSMKIMQQMQGTPQIVEDRHTNMLLRQPALALTKDSAQQLQEVQLMAIIPRTAMAKDMKPLTLGAEFYMSTAYLSPGHCPRRMEHLLLPQPGLCQLNTVLLPDLQESQ